MDAGSYAQRTPHRMLEVGADTRERPCSRRTRRWPAQRLASFIGLASGEELPPTFSARGAARPMPDFGRPYMEATTLDDLLHVVMRRIEDDGAPIVSSSGPNKEVWGATLVLTNPLARVSRSEARGKVFSPLGEFCWYLSGSDRAAAILHYVDKYPNRLADGRVFGAYGPRLRNKNGADQLEQVVSMLRRKRDSRRAVIQIFDSADNLDPDQSLQPPCTCTLQFLVRDDALHLITYMRSNDVVKGMTHDVFCFTMIQELVARSLDLPLGTYTHVVGSLHVYDRDADQVEAFLAEDWQQTAPVMPAMPPGDPGPGLGSLLAQEARLREDGADVDVELPQESYWADLVRLLQVYALTPVGPLRPEHGPRVAALSAELECRAYAPFVTQRLDGRA